MVYGTQITIVFMGFINQQTSLGGPTQEPPYPRATWKGLQLSTPRDAGFYMVLHHKLVCNWYVYSMQLGSWNTQ